MIAQITPLVQVASRNTWLKASASHVLGSTLSGSLLGFVLGVLGLAIGLDHIWPSAGLLLASLMLFCAARDVRLVRWPLISLRRQTPAWFPRVYGWAGGSFLWGVDLGQGWTTLISFSSYYVLVFGALLIAHPLYSTLLMATYGLGRGLPVLIAGLRSDTNGDASCSIFYFRYQAIVQLINAVALAFLAGHFIHG